MTEDVDVSAAINGARALLASARASGLRQAHVATADFECFIAFSAASANPMRRAAPDVAPATADEIVSAPHVATLVEVVPLHATVAAGDMVATLRVLDRSFPLTASVAGTVTAVAKVGDLLEYDAPVVGLSLRS